MLPRTTRGRPLGQRLASTKAPRAGPLDFEGDRRVVPLLKGDNDCTKLVHDFAAEPKNCELIIHAAMPSDRVVLATGESTPDTVWVNGAPEIGQNTVGSVQLGRSAHPARPLAGDRESPQQV